MSNSSRFSAGFVACFILGLFLCGAGVATALSIKSGKVECIPTNSTVNNNETVKPASNAVANCIAASELESQAKVTSQSTAAFGCILVGVAIMTSEIGFSIMNSNARLSQLGGAPVPPQQPYGQFPAPGQPYPYPPQERPQPSGG